MPAGTMLCDFRQWALSKGGAHSGLSMHRHIHGLVPYQDVGTAPPRLTNPLRVQYPFTYSDAGLMSFAHCASDGYAPGDSAGVKSVGMSRGSTPYPHRFAPC